MATVVSVLSPCSNPAGTDEFRHEWQCSSLSMRLGRHIRRGENGILPHTTLNIKCICLDQ